MIERIKAKFVAIARHPELGEACAGVAKNLREFPVGSYVIYYVPIDDGIAVVRVIHAARDTSSIDFE